MQLLIRAAPEIDKGLKWAGKEYKAHQHKQARIAWEKEQEQLEKERQLALDLLDSEMKGLKLLMNGDIDNSILFLKRAISLGSKKETIQGALAFAYFNQGNYVEAFKILDYFFSGTRRFTDIQPGIDFHHINYQISAWRINELIFEFISEKRMHLSEVTCSLIQRKIIFQKPNRETLIWIAAELLRLGDLSSALRIFNFLSEETMFLSLTEEQQQQISFGNFVSNAIKDNNINDDIYKLHHMYCIENETLDLLAIILKKYNFIKPESINILEKYYRQNPSDLEVYEILLNYFYRSSSFDRAIALADCAETRIINKPDLVNKTANIYLENNMLDKAIIIIQKTSLKDFPIDQSAQLLSLLGKAYQAKGLLDLALASLKQIQKPDQRVEEVFQLGLSAKEAKKNDFALQCFSEVYREDAGYKNVSAKIDEIVRSENGN